MPTDPDIARIAAGLTKAQRFAASGCGDLADSFPCHLCEARSPSGCSQNNQNKQAYIYLIQRFGSLDRARAHLLASQTSGEGK